MPNKEYGYLSKTKPNSLCSLKATDWATYRLLIKLSPISTKSVVSHDEVTKQETQIYKHSCL